MSFLLDRLYLFHWVSPEAGRSAQPYLGFYHTFLRSHGFKTVINLRGFNARHQWWQTERRVTDDLRIAHFDVRLSSRNIPSRTSLAALFEAFEKGKTPMLFKCSGGQDRSALASALFLLNRNGPSALSDAQRQFSFWPYLHHPKRHQSWLREFPAYAVLQAGSRLSSWARERYRPEDFAAYLLQKGLTGSYRAIQAEE
jgi:protein tyrosine/serine phosphatase